MLFGVPSLVSACSAYPRKCPVLPQCDFWGWGKTPLLKSLCSSETVELLEVYAGDKHRILAAV